MFGRMFSYLSGVWLAKRPDDERGSRFAVGGVVVNLTGQGSAARSFAWPEAGLVTTLTPREWNLAVEDAAALLMAIEAGDRPRSLLPWVPLMNGAGEVDIVEWWKRIADGDPGFRRRAEFGGLARTFADAADRHQLWAELLKGWNVRESISVNEWIAEGREEGLALGLKRGQQEGETVGKRVGKLEFLEAMLTGKFGPLADDILARLRALPDAELDTMPNRLWSAASLADLGL